MSKTNKRNAWYGLSLITLFCFGLILAACGTVNSNSTAISQTIRPVTVANNVGSGTLPTDPTRNPDLAAGATSTPGRPTSTPAQATTPAPGATTPAGGATATSGTGGGTVNAAQAQSAFNRVCAGCHPSFGAAAGIGPALRGPFTNDAANIVNIVRNGRGNMQPIRANQISDADLQNLATWIKQRYHP
jgi:mono/diheme cytochrome c family protein